MWFKAADPSSFVMSSAASLADKDDAASTSCTRVVNRTLPGGGYSTIPLWRTLIMMTGLTMQLVCKTCELACACESQYKLISTLL